MEAEAETFIPGVIPLSQSLQDEFHPVALSWLSGVKLIRLT